MHGGIGAPGTPGEGARDEILRAIQASGLAQAQIGGGKGIWITQGAQSNIVRGPLANAGYFPETAHRGFEKSPGRKMQPAVGRVACPGAERFRPGQRQANFRQVARVQRGGAFRRRGEVRQPVPRSIQRRTKARRQASGQGGRRSDADLLAEDGPQTEFEDIPRSRNAQSGMPFDHRTQELVLPEMIGDLFWVGVQIEKFAHMLDQWKKHRRKRCRHAKTKRVALRQQLDFQPAARFSDLHRTRVSVSKTASTPRVARACSQASNSRQAKGGR